jgi:hypothetical protein
MLYWLTPFPETGMLLLKIYLQFACQKLTGKHFISRESQKALFYDNFGDYFKMRWFDKYSKGGL